MWCVLIKTSHILRFAKPHYFCSFWMPVRTQAGEWAAARTTRALVTATCLYLIYLPLAHKNTWSKKQQQASPPHFWTDFTFWGLRFPLTTSMKSSSDTVRVTSAFPAWGPSCKEPLPFFRSMAVWREEGGEAGWIMSTLQRSGLPPLVSSALPPQLAVIQP